MEARQLRGVTFTWSPRKYLKGAKSLVDPRARKWSVSSQHHLLSGHARDASNGRGSFPDYGRIQADQPTRPIPDRYRGHAAYTPEDNDIRRESFAANGRFQVDCQPTRPIHDHYGGQNAYKPEDNGFRRESFAANGRLQADCQPARPIPDHYRGHNAYTPEDIDIRQHSIRDLDNASDDMKNVVRMRSSNLGRRESSPNHNERYRFSDHGIPGAFYRVPTHYDCSTPQKVAVQPKNFQHRMNERHDIGSRSSISCAPLDKVGFKGPMYHGENLQTSRNQTQLGQDRSQYARFPPQGLNSAQKASLDKVGFKGPMYHGENLQTSRNQTQLGQDRSQYARFPPQGLNSAQKASLDRVGFKGPMYHGENLQTSRNQTQLGQDRSQYARFPPEGLNSAQKNALAMKSDIEAWQEETKRINAMRSHAEASAGSVQTGTQPTILDTNPFSKTEEVLSMSNEGRHNTPMPTSAALDSGAPMQKLDHVPVEESVPVEGPIATETGGKQVGLTNPNKITSAQNHGLQHPENRNIYSPKISISRQVPSLEKVVFHSESTRRTGHISTVTDTAGVCGNKSIPRPPENTSLDQEGKKGRLLSMENRGGCRINQEKNETPVTKDMLIGLDNGQNSPINEVGAGVMASESNNVPEKLKHLYKKICIVDKVETAKMVAGKLMGEYKNLIHACDTEVADIDIKKESPVGHGKIICFSIYCGSQADFGNGESCVWVDVLGGGEDVLSVFSPYFRDTSIQKVWHNYSFDKHIIENHGINVDGFHADTMHLARLWNSARSREGGYSLEALTKDPKVMDGSGAENEDELIMGKDSMKSIFGKKKIKKDGTEGKVITLAPVEELQRTERIPWICYSALDSISTLRLWKSLKSKLEKRDWVSQGVRKGNMYEFYTNYWRPFGVLLVQMESEGMLVDRNYLSEMEKVAVREQEISGSRFRKWASKRCPDACYMNVGSDAQVRQLLFGGTPNKKDPSQVLPRERTFRVPNVDKFIEEGKKSPLKFRNIVLRGLGVQMEVEATTPSGWQAVTGASLKTLAGKVSVDYDSLLHNNDDELPADLDEGPGLTSDGGKDGEKSFGSEEEIDSSIYGTAYNAFEGGQSGREACHAITALCEVSSINTLISNFLQPLQGKEISGPDKRVHCSLNINTETGRLSARKPNLQNQPALEKDRYKIRKAFIAGEQNSLIVADYGQLELRILAHLSNCKSMLDAFKAGGDFHSRTAMNMYPHVREAVEKGKVLLEWDPQPGEEKPPIPLLKDLFATERRKAKMLNFSIAYGKTAIGLSKDWKVSEEEAKKTVKLWYNERLEVLKWQSERKKEAHTSQCVHTLLGRARHFPNMKSASSSLKGHIERAAINTPVQGSAADVAMCAMLEISRNSQLKKLGWKLLLQVHDEVILEGPTENAEEAKSLVVQCMSNPFDGKNILSVDLAVDAKCALNWYEGK